VPVLLPTTGGTTAIRRGMRLSYVLSWLDEQIIRVVDIRIKPIKPVQIFSANPLFFISAPFLFVLKVSAQWIVL
jgi:hypothetical protein